jgi:Fe-S-cluster containining protein
MKCSCRIYKRKPDVCRNYPSVPHELRESPSCTYWFKDDKLQGECSRCGECCKRPYLYLPKFNKKFTEEPCPYLVKYVD